MRHSMRALIGVMLVGCCSAQVFSAESSPAWWRFGRSKSETVAPPAIDGAAQPAAPTSIAPQSTLPQGTLPEYSTVEEPEQSWMINSPFTKVSWPRIHMPEMPKPTLPTSPWAKKEPEADPTRNRWVETPPEAVKPSPMQSVSNGARRVGESTKAAWHKTVDALTPGEPSDSSAPSSRVARRERGSAWSRMFSSDTPTKKEGSQTIPEFMAQDRLDP